MSDTKQPAKVRKPERWPQWYRRTQPVHRETVIRNTPSSEWTTGREIVERIERDALWYADDPHECEAISHETPFGTYYCVCQGVRTVYVAQDGKHFYLACDSRPVVDLRGRYFLSLYEAVQSAARGGFTHFRQADCERRPIEDVAPPPVVSILDGVKRKKGGRK